MGIMRPSTAFNEHLSIIPTILRALYDALNIIFKVGICKIYLLRLRITVDLGF